MSLPICRTLRKERALKTYIGSKIIHAEPMEKDGMEGYKVVYPDGYESWSPKGVFENAYRRFTLGEINLVKKGE